VDANAAFTPQHAQGVVVFHISITSLIFIDCLSCCSGLEVARINVYFSPIFYQMTGLYGGLHMGLLRLICAGYELRISLAGF
jgi:hypothetical protein